jgi:hypothetical protein
MESQSSNRQRPIIYCYGAAQFNPNAPGDELSTPNKAALRACDKFGEGTVVLVDEFRTTRLSRHTHEPLDAVYSRKLKKQLHGLFISRPDVSDQGVIIPPKYERRDPNAGFNIEYVAYVEGTEDERPLAFQRGVHEALGPIQVGRNMKDPEAKPKPKKPRTVRDIDNSI